MQILKNLWTTISGEGVAKETLRGDVTAGKLRAALQSHPTCGKDLFCHSYALLATAVFSGENESRVLKFFKALRERRWQELVEFQDWDATRDNVEAYVIRCKPERVLLLVLHSPYELYEDDSVVECEDLGEESGQQITSFIQQNQWKSLLS